MNNTYIPRVRELRALILTRIHWQENEVDPLKATTGGTQCELCKEFFNPESRISRLCRNCPIFKKTGLSRCRGTPYEWASRLIVASKHYTCLGCKSPSVHDISHACHQEVLFIQDLIQKLYPMNWRSK